MNGATTNLQNKWIFTRCLLPLSTSIIPRSNILQLHSHETKRTITSSLFVTSGVRATQRKSFGSDQVTIRQMSSNQHAIVNHKSAYEESMAGRHGKQLALAYKEGSDKDKEEIDYFALMESSQADESVLKIHDDTLSGEESDLEGPMEETEENDYDYFDDDADETEIEQYNNDGSLSSRSESELIALRSGAPAGGNFAIIQLEGFQHKVAVDDVIITNKLKPLSLWKLGRKLTLKSNGEIEMNDVGNESDIESGVAITGVGEVLMVANSDKTYVGLPAVKGAEVDVMVEEITRDKTIIVFKKRRRKNSRRKNGFRREVTFLRVLDIRMPEDD